MRPQVPETGPVRPKNRLALSPLREVSQPPTVIFISLRAQARLSALVEEHWQALAATSARMDTVDASTAMIIEFGDYECPFCRDSHAHLEAVMESHPDATIGFRHYPLTDIHPRAEDAVAFAAHPVDGVAGHRRLEDARREGGRGRPGFVRELPHGRSSGTKAGGRHEARRGTEGNLNPDVLLPSSGGTSGTRTRNSSSN